ncbi:TRAP transporter large permease [Aquabacter spiritensis]|uniref:TRAP transporter large permease protein n=1 Tax=Aquabacter spiritensis TaxID=933073 RepID=A0A4R3M1T1_9HYPH|nr:TRAP transporter large permease [Aquabacter spiritensis]TCT06683.1 tripartite ATP-independent transporter DctM subunit [Aquabacter spiritensis]
MFDATQMMLVVGVLLGLVFLGTHIAVALGITSALGIYLMMNGDLEVVRSFISNTAYEAIRDYIFAVIPLFILMGEFLARCGAASDLFTLVNRLTKWLPGRLGIATVFANAIFAFVSGVSIAAAAAFSRIAYPEMKRYGYDRQFSLACIAGSACLGMLIPPSVLMIVWGVITEQSIGSLFLAGIVPGFLVVTAYCVYIVIFAIRNPALVGEAAAPGVVSVTASGTAVAGRGGPRVAAVAPVVEDADFRKTLVGTLLVLVLILSVLGGIWFGVFTPTEGAGVGATLALFIAIGRGMRLKEIFDVVLTVGRTSAPLLLLLVMAQLYSRVLSMTGITGAVQAFFLDTGLPPLAILGIMILIWFVLGCVIDSISIILLTVPVFAPIAAALGYDPLAFAMIGIIAIETGLLTPPFGILVFTVKAALPQENLSVGEIFRGAVPFWICLLTVIVLLIVFPQIATWLPNLGKVGG